LLRTYKKLNLLSRTVLNFDEDILQRGSLKLRRIEHV
jgi:hypothetical protein